jgi:hypothetical protein
LIKGWSFCDPTRLAIGSSLIDSVDLSAIHVSQDCVELIADKAVASAELAVENLFRLFTIDCFKVVVPWRKVWLKKQAVRFFVAKLKDFLDLKAFTKMLCGPANGLGCRFYSLGAAIERAVAITSTMSSHIVLL